MRAAIRVTTSTTSSGPRPFRISKHSMTSSALPIARPSGAFISVRIASVRTPTRVPMATIALASARAPARSFMNAPSPHLTSSTSALLPSAIFLLMMEAAMRGMLLTVAVTSRSAYSFLSAGASEAVWPMMAVPTSRRTCLNSSIERPMRNPGMDSSLSSVPPVCPSPRPDIFGTTTPQAAATGASTSDTLSPTPPVLCLPTLTPGISDRSIRSPERTMASVSQAVSSSVIPLRTMAMSNAEA